MDLIDAKWIIDRLTGRRGEKADLARALGLREHQVSKILSGERRVQADEVPKLLAYFQPASASAPDGDITHQLLARIEQLSDAERGVLLGTANALFALRQGEER